MRRNNTGSLKNKNFIGDENGKEQLSAKDIMQVSAYTVRLISIIIISSSSSSCSLNLNLKELTNEKLGNRFFIIYVGEIGRASCRERV